MSTLHYFRANATRLGFNGTLLWTKADLQSDPIFASNLTHLLDLQNETTTPLELQAKARPYCAGFKALMLWRGMQMSEPGDYVMWADATRHFDYSQRKPARATIQAVMERLQQDGHTDAFGFVWGCRNSSWAYSTLQHQIKYSPTLVRFFPLVDSMSTIERRKLEMNSAHLLLQNNPRNRALVQEFLQYYVDYASARAVCQAHDADQALWNLMGVSHGLHPLNICKCSGGPTHKDLMAVIDQLAAGRYTASGDCVHETEAPKMEAAVAGCEKGKRTPRGE